MLLARLLDRIFQVLVNVCALLAYTCCLLVIVLIILVVAAAPAIMYFFGRIRRAFAASVFALFPDT